jgi:hypothetical protein
VATAIAGAIAGAGAGAFYGFCALGLAAGVMAGRRIPADECSGCGSRLTVREDRCERCGANVVGEIASPEERLEAEERYRAQHGSANADVDDEEEDPISVLFTAMLAAWGLSRGLIRADASEAQRELERRVRANDFDTEALFATWVKESLLTDDAMEFASFYATEATELRTRDFEMLATANKLDDRVVNYERFAKVLDRRFADWNARADAGRPAIGARRT